MSNFDGCQLPNLPKISEGLVKVETQSFFRRIKLSLAVPWNYYAKRWLKQIYSIYAKRLTPIKRMNDMKLAHVELPQPVLARQPGEFTGAHQQQSVGELPQMDAVDPVRPGKLNTGDWVRVRSWEEIQPMLDPFKETRGCAFLEDMRQYCGTKQRVLKSMERFLDERDYKVKKVRGVILLENVICNGTPTFGKCDRCCFLFWREEWLEKITV